MGGEKENPPDAAAGVVCTDEPAGGPLSRGRLPTVAWERRGRQYACFLSHFKEEAGSDARYLHDLLQQASRTRPARHM